MTPKKASAYQGKTQKVEKVKTIVVAPKSTHSPSPPATAGDEIDLTMKAANPDSIRQEMPREAVLDSMRRSYKVVGERCFDWYKWSSHIYWAIARLGEELVDS